MSDKNYLIHGRTKGSTNKDHKYLRIENGRYIYEETKNALGKAGSAIKQTAGAVKSKGQDYISSLAKTAKNTGKSAAKAVKKKAGEVADKAEDIYENAVKPMAKAKYREARYKTVKTAEKVRDKAQEIGEDISEAAKLKMKSSGKNDVYDKLAKKKLGLDEVEDTVSSIKKKVESIDIRSLAKHIIDSGRNKIENVADKIKDFKISDVIPEPSVEKQLKKSDKKVEDLKNILGDENISVEERKEINNDLRNEMMNQKVLNERAGNTPKQNVSVKSVSPAEKAAYDKEISGIENRIKNAKKRASNLLKLMNRKYRNDDMEDYNDYMHRYDAELNNIKLMNEEIERIKRQKEGLE